MTINAIPPRVSRSSVLLTGTLALLLLLGLGFQVIQRAREVPNPKPRTRIAEIIPKGLDGWTVADEPLGQTEAVSASALKTLNFDDYAYRSFHRGGHFFTVYAAYWAPGRMPTRLVASHTPDRCWTENGMRCVETGFRQPYAVGDRPIFPGEYRAFVPGAGGEKTFVIYWHVVEGNLYDYGGRFNAVPDPWLWWKDTVQQVAYGSREQLFVRIASDLPMNELWPDRDFQKIMSTVAGMGLFPPRVAQR